MRFLTQQKRQQVAWKLVTGYLSSPAKRPGLYRGRLRAFCLPVERAEENLMPLIREEALAHFRLHRVAWHMPARPGIPTNHLCSSQVFGVNFLFPFLRYPDAFSELMQTALPDLLRVLPMVASSDILAFEWRPPLCSDPPADLAEAAVRRHIGKTVFDFAFRYRSARGHTVHVAGEFKYTEAGRGVTGREGRHGLAALHGSTLYPFKPDRSALPCSVSSPAFEQLLRQQLLIHLYERQLEATARVVLLYLCPLSNRDLRQPWREEVGRVGTDLFRAWGSSLVEPSRFVVASPEGLFNVFPIGEHPVLRPWYAYMQERYRFLETR